MWNLLKNKLNPQAAGLRNFVVTKGRLRLVSCWHRTSLAKRGICLLWWRHLCVFLDPLNQCFLIFLAVARFSMICENYAYPTYYYQCFLTFFVLPPLSIKKTTHHDSLHNNKKILPVKTCLTSQLSYWSIQCSSTILPLRNLWSVCSTLRNTDMQLSTKNKIFTSSLVCRVVRVSTVPSPGATYRSCVPDLVPNAVSRLVYRIPQLYSATLDCPFSTCFISSRRE